MFSRVIDDSNRKNKNFCDSHKKESKKDSTEGSFREDKDTFTWNFRDIYTRMWYNFT